ncbi:uncharacterized protein LOC135696192 [Rhopilema esculentum]|uniref:uncharacterized protein LOC135696192 n=1 Tax=Rhopilema esculentum TaxID=499914 RepID=UPI0031CFDF25
MATSSKENKDGITSNVQGQSSKPQTEVRNPSRPVVSTIDPRHNFKRFDAAASFGDRANANMDSENEEIRRLENEVKRLRGNLASSDATIKKLMKRDKEMASRLSEEVQRHVKQSGKFENLSHGGVRLSQLIEKYETLYSQGRLDALDELDEVPLLRKMKKREDIKNKIMAGIMIASFRICQDYAGLIRASVHSLLGVQKNHTEFAVGNPDADIKHHIEEYLQSTTERYNIEQMVKDVEDQLKEILPELPDFLSSKPYMATYVCECVRLSWAIVNQVPPVEIEYTSERFSDVMHSRFHTSDSKCQWIKMYAWPTLVDSKNKNIMSRGIVIT